MRQKQYRKHNLWRTVGAVVVATIVAGLTVLAVNSEGSLSSLEGWRLMVSVGLVWIMVFFLALFFTKPRQGVPPSYNPEHVMGALRDDVDHPSSSDA